MDKKALNRRQFLGKALKVLPIIAMIPFSDFSSTVENFASSFSKASTACNVTVKEHAVELVEVNVPRTVRAAAIFNVQNNVRHSVEMAVNQCIPKDVRQIAVKDAPTGVLLCHNFEEQCHSL